MSVSFYSQSELLKFSAETDHNLILLCHNHKPERIARMAKELKKALTEYSKHKKFDDVQLNVVANIARLEKWSRYYFKQSTIKTYRRLGWDEIRIKKQVRIDWEAFYEKYWRY